MTSFVRVGEEVDPGEIPCLDRLAGDHLDLVADDAEIMELTVRKPTQLGNRLAINAPVTIATDQVHCLNSLQNWFGPFAVRSGLDRLAGDVVDVAAADAEVGQFTVRQAVQLGNGFPVAAPVAVVADQVHGSSRFVFSSDHSVCVRTENMGDRIDLKVPLAHGSNANCAMQH